MKTALFSTRRYEKPLFESVNGDFGHALTFFESRLCEETISLAAGFPAVCVFVNDLLNRPVLEALAQGGARLVALRCAGFNNVDLTAAAELGIQVVRVPAYSPHAVAEHTIALVLTLNRKIHKAYNRVREANFSLDGLMGFDLYGKTVGLIGLGKIGVVTARILLGFGCRVLAFDPQPSGEARSLPVEFAALDRVFSESHVISLHCPLLPATRHLINRDAIARMRPGVMIVNTSRGALVDTRAVIEGLKSRHIGGLALDVYEEEEELFFEDHSASVLQDDVFARLLTFPNVIITGHQGFFTQEALDNIVRTTLSNIRDIEVEGRCANEVRCEGAPRRMATVPPTILG
jgi:D-lactate dehydrogenase